MIVYVVIVTYNPKKWIDKCFSSLRSSTIPLKVIVIDNGSKDGSQDIIRVNYPEVELFQSSENLGFGKANNIGIKKAYDESADYVFLLNQDAWIEPDTIEKLTNAMKAEPDFGILSPIHLNGKGDAFDDNFLSYISNNKCKNLLSHIFLGTIQKTIYPVKFVNAAGWLLSKTCIETIGGFSPSFFHYGEDNNYVNRLSFHKLKIGILPQTIIFHDRENRSGNIYTDDWKNIYKKNIILQASNPLEEFSFQKELYLQFSELLKSVLKFDYKRFLVAFSKLKMINGIAKEQIKNSRSLSIQKGPTFL